MLKHALIIADGKLGVGLGHISRSLALKEELESQGCCVEFLDSSLLETFRFQRFYDFIALDSYVLPLQSYVLVTKHAKNCLFFDDTLRLDYPQGMLLNNARDIDAKSYKQKYPNHILLLGDGYALTQHAFKYHPLIPLHPSLRRCLITLGGTDVLGLTPPLVDALLASFPSLQILCITQGSTHFPKGVEVYSRLDAKAMAQCIRSVDLCICTCGQSLREILLCGVPAIALEVARNQQANLQSYRSCTLNVPKAYILPKNVIIEKILGFVESYKDLSLRQTHRNIAQQALKHRNLWKNVWEVLSRDSIKRAFN